MKPRWVMPAWTGPESPQTPVPAETGTAATQGKGSRRRKPASEVQPCGTPAAYARHLYWDEDPCLPCCLAEKIRRDTRRNRPDPGPALEEIRAQRAEFWARH